VHKLAQSVLAYIRKGDLLRPGDRVGVAVSGGIDSVALLRILLELCQELGIVLSVVHLNHTLRGTESDADEQFVRDLARVHELECFAETRDVKAYAAERKLSIETAARELRYEFFKKLLCHSTLDKVLTAHTLDDQAETVLMKFLSGTGTRGLAGIYPRISMENSDRAIIRPLLATTRASLSQYLADLHQTWREDSSNLELRHTRNRIRREILPLLKTHVNANVQETLSEVVEIARAEEEFWASETKRHMASLWSRSPTGGSLLWGDMENLSLALRRRLVRAAAESLDLNLEFGHVQDVLGLCDEGAQIALPNGWTTLLHKGQVRFERCGHPAVDYEYPLVVPGKVAVAEAGIVVETAWYPSNNLPRFVEDQRYNPDGLLDLRYAQGKLVVRNWRAGDRFWPSHRKEAKKIKELLQDRHVTGEEKKRWPVIASSDEVVWLGGFGVGQEFRARSDEGVLIREEPIEPHTGN
jgi:tRNA(Ile)-lysidine synthase